MGGGKWRFALTEYTDLIDVSEGDIEEWEEGLEPIWEALVSFIADAPLLLAEVKRLHEAIEYAIVHAENYDVIRVLDEVMEND